MTIVLVMLVASGSGYFLQISPGVVSQGIGGASIVLDEGLPAFHNPALSQGMQFSVIATKWVFSTSMVTASGCFDDFSCGMTYLNYGTIQGYDLYGNVTHAFTPFSLCAAISRKMGIFGISAKGFGEKIDTRSLAGACMGFSVYARFGRFGLGAKIDNLGREFIQNTTIPFVVGVGLRADINDAVCLIIESKSPDIELNAGIQYTYDQALLVFGVKYLKPKDTADNADIGFRFSDLWYSGGIMVNVGAYAFGYAFVLHEFTTSHNLGIKFIPGQNR